MIRRPLWSLVTLFAIAGLAVVPPAEAQHCYPTASAYAPSYPTHHATPIFATELRFLTLFTPTYVVTKAEAPPAAAGQDELTKAVNRNTDVLAELLRKSAGVPVAAATPSPVVPPATTGPIAGEAHLRVFQARCSSCHDKSAPRGGFAFLAKGKLMEISDRDVNRILKATYKGTMPKNGKLSDEEFAAIMAWESEPALR